MLSDFFRVNLPYGLMKNKNNNWMAFNREYKPIGFNVKTEITSIIDNEENNHFFYSCYPLLFDSFIMELVDYDEDSIKRDRFGNIERFWLYNDQTNPMNQQEQDNEHWKIYWTKLELLAKLRIV